jgi:hypothetical protein
MPMSDYVTTPRLGLKKPTEDADDDKWGGHLNENADILDNVLPLTGGTLSGPLQLPTGTVAAPALALGGTDAGFYRSSLNIGVSLGGNLAWLFNPGVTVGYTELSMSGHVVSSLADPLNATDALNLRTGDARYLLATGGPFLPLTGGTLTGPLTVSRYEIIDGGTTGPAQLFLDASAGGQHLIAARSGGNMRWTIQPGDMTAETGGNAGTNFVISRYSDAGSFIDNAMQIDRATGVADFSKAPTAAGVGFLKLTGGSLTGSVNIADTSTGSALAVQNHGSGYGFEVIDDTQTDAVAIEKSGNGAALVITSSVAGDAITITNSGTGKALVITDNSPVEAVRINNYGGGNALTIVQGAVILARDPVQPLEAATKRYIDAADALRITDAPADSAYYARRNNVWAVAPGGMTDAPSDGSAYGRLNAAWAKVLPLAGGTVTGNVAVNGTLTQGTTLATRLTAKGNLMLGGVAEPASMSTATGVDGGSLRAWYTTANNYMSSMYYDGTNYRRLNATTAPAQITWAGGTQYSFQSAAVGAADSVVSSITTLATLDNAGNFTAIAGLFSAGGTVGSVGANPRMNLYVSGAPADQKYVDWFADASGSFGMQLVNDAFNVGTNFLLVTRSGYAVTGMTLTAPTVQINGHLAVSNGIMNTNARFYVAGSYAYYMERNSSTGSWNWVDNNNLIMAVNTSGDFTAIRDVISNGSVYSNGNLYVSGQSTVIGVGGSGRIMQFQPGWYWDWNTTNGTLAWQSAIVGTQWVMSNNSFCYNNASNVGGHGAYSDLSDERVKANIQPTHVGLDEILALEPINFTRVSRAIPLAQPRREPAPEIGFSAQQLRGVIPEAVTEWPDDLNRTAKDDAAPLLGMMTTPVVAALVNAVKTLNARLSALETKP